MNTVRRVRHRIAARLGFADKLARRRLAAYLFFTFSMTFGLWRTQIATHKANSATARICTSAKVNRDVLIGVVDKAYNGAGGGGTGDLTQIPAFAKLDEPNKEMWRQVSAAINRAPASGSNRVPDDIRHILAKKVC